MNLADKDVEPHEVIHVGVTDENSADRFQLPFGHMVEGAAVDHDAAMDGTVADDQTGVFDETGEEIRFQVAKETAHVKDKVEVEVKVEVFP